MPWTKGRKDETLGWSWSPTHNGIDTSIKNTSPSYPRSSREADGYAVLLRGVSRQDALGEPHQRWGPAGWAHSQLPSADSELVMPFTKHNVQCVPLAVSAGTPCRSVPSVGAPRATFDVQLQLERRVGKR